LFILRVSDVVFFLHLSLVHTFDFAFAKYIFQYVFTSLSKKFYLQFFSSPLDFSLFLHNNTFLYSFTSRSFFSHPPSNQKYSHSSSINSLLSPSQSPTDFSSNSHEQPSEQFSSFSFPPKYKKFSSEFHSNLLMTDIFYEFLIAVPYTLYLHSNSYSVYKKTTVSVDQPEENDFFGSQDYSLNKLKDKCKKSIPYSSFSHKITEQLLYLTQKKFYDFYKYNSMRKKMFLKGKMRSPIDSNLDFILHEVFGYPYHSNPKPIIYPILPSLLKRCFSSTISYIHPLNVVVIVFFFFFYYIIYLFYFLFCIIVCKRKLKMHLV
jgi:hypothetical protein